MRRFKFHPAARKELREAILFYDERAVGLGREFLDEVNVTIGRICDMPAAWPKLAEGVRRCAMHRFPYGIIYRETNRMIEIVAVMHQHRHPDSWKGR